MRARPAERALATRSVFLPMWCASPRFKLQPQTRQRMMQEAASRVQAARTVLPACVAVVPLGIAENAAHFEVREFNRRPKFPDSLSEGRQYHVVPAPAFMLMRKTLHVIDQFQSLLFGHYEQLLVLRCHMDPRDASMAETSAGHRGCRQPLATFIEKLGCSSSSDSDGVRLHKR